MRKILLAAVAVAFAALLGGCGGGGGDSGGPAPPVTPVQGRTVITSIASQQTGISYDLQIRLPAGYDQGSTAYPIIYQMDLESRFLPSVDVLTDRHVTAILVGIGNMGADRRFVDFEMPGAANYYRFLTLELIPFIESQFRADPQQRILNGHSLSGLMVMYALFMEPPGNRHYASFISEDGSMFEQPSILYGMEQQMFTASNQLPVKLAMSADSAGNLTNVIPLCATIRARGYGGLQLEMLEYGLGHVPMDIHAFGDSLDYIFGNSREPDGDVVTCK